MDFHGSDMKWTRKIRKRGGEHDSAVQAGLFVIRVTFCHCTVVCLSIR